jgi:hypothetical protein
MPHTRKGRGPRRGKAIAPGAHVGRRSAADDAVPQIQMTRGLTAHHYDRGRERPAVSLDRSRRRRPEDSAQGRGGRG